MTFILFYPCSAPTVIVLFHPIPPFLLFHSYFQYFFFFWGVGNVVV
jgi:hypothetical protein